MHLLSRTPPVVFAFLACVVAGSAMAQTPGADVPGDLVVTQGEGLIKIAPDQAFVTVASESRAKSAQEAQRLNAQAAQAVTDTLKKASLAPDAIRTISYDLSPEFDFTDGRQVLRGYVARNSIEVRVDDITRVGEVVQLAVGSGATSISGIRFGLKNRVDVERQALAAAVKQARARADAMAVAAGRSIERVIRIDDQAGFGGPPPRPMYARARMAEAAEAASAAPPPIEAGDLEITARVQLTVRLK
jgi:uncharacterized protein YggE